MRSFEVPATLIYGISMGPCRLCYYVNPQKALHRSILFWTNVLTLRRFVLMCTDNGTRWRADMYTPGLAKAIGDVLIANRALDAAMKSLVRQDIEKIMNDSGYMDKYATTTFARIGARANVYCYTITFYNDNEGRMDTGTVYIETNFTSDGELQLNGDY